MSSIYQTYKPAGSSADGLYLRLKDGDAVKLRLASPPVIYTQTYEDKESGETTVSTKYAWVVWNRAEKKAQVFSGGKSIFNQLAELIPEWGEPTEFDVTIKRTGEMLETRYSVIPVPKSADLTPEEVAKVEEVDLLAATKGQWLADFFTKKVPVEESPEGSIVSEGEEQIDLNAIFPEEE